MQKKTDPETFEYRINEQVYVSATLKTQVVKYERARDLCREADQQLEKLTKERDTLQEAWEGCTESAPLELVELVEALIKAAKGELSTIGRVQLLEHAEATIERWKV